MLSERRRDRKKECKGIWFDRQTDKRGGNRRRDEGKVTTIYLFCQ